MEIDSYDIYVDVNDTESITITNASSINEAYTFTSQDTSIATVDTNGVITGVSEGTTTVTITGSDTHNTKIINVYVTGPGSITTFNITPLAVQNYLSNVETWKNGTKDEFLANMQMNFESNDCKMNSDSSIKYASGSTDCDRARGYDTGTNAAIKVYLYDDTNDVIGSEVHYTSSDSGIINNMIPEQAYYWELASDTTVNGKVKAVATKNRRLLNTLGIRNTRDLGGLSVDSNNDGVVDGYLKYGKMFRGERTYNQSANITLLENLGANQEIALYSSGEQSNNLRLTNYRLDTIVHYQVHPTNNTSNYNTIRAAIIRAMQDVIDGKNIYFHCVYGSDRTGTLAYVLEGLLGVVEEERIEDYELSVFFGEVDRNRYFETDIKSSLPKFVYMRTFLTTNQSIYDWFMQGSSDQAADQALIQNFRTAMISSTVNGD